MEFVCEDLPESGVVLIPSSSPEYGPLLADIRWRTDDPVEGSPPFPRKQIAEEDRELSAILVNRSQFGIAAVQQEWRFHKADFPGFDGLTPTYRSIFGPGANPSVLLPFGLLPKQLKLYGYWHVILPGSKHYLSPAGELIGDNSDVRPPEPDEVWTGGGVRWGGAGGDRSYAAVEKVTLTLDGVFFTDGTFIGPNRYQLWEQVTGRAAAYAQLIRISSDGRDQGKSTGDILADIETLTGPATDRPPRRGPRPWNPGGYPDIPVRMLGWQIGNRRTHGGDDAALAMILSWAEARAPQFRKL